MRPQRISELTRPDALRWIGPRPCQLGRGRSKAPIPHESPVSLYSCDHPKMLECFLNRGPLLRWARSHAATSPTVRSLTQRQSPDLFAVGNPAGFRSEPKFVLHPFLNFTIAGHEQILQRSVFLQHHSIARTIRAKSSAWKGRRRHRSPLLDRVSPRPRHSWRVLRLFFFLARHRFLVPVTAAPLAV